MGVIEGWKHGIAFLANQSFGFDFSLVLGLADDAGFGAERADAVELVLRHQFRHADDAGHSGLARRVGQGAAVIAGRNRGHPAGAGRELQHRVHRAAQLERAGGLQVFVGEQNFGVKAVRQDLRSGDAQGLDMGGDTRARRLDICETDLTAHALCPC